MTPDRTSAAAPDPAGPQSQALQGATAAQTGPTANAPGPWVQAFQVSIDAPFRSKSNFRRSTTGSGRGEWARQRKFEDDLRLVVAAALPDGWDMGSADHTVANRPVVVMLICARTLLDAANLSKSVPDAVEGLVYHNDASVASVVTLAERTGRAHGGEVAFCRLQPGATPGEVLAAGAELGRRWLEGRAPT
jgi:hypothetical protein